MDMNDLLHFLDELYYPEVKEVIDELKRQVQRLIDIGLDYLQLDRQTPSLSGGEAQRVKLVKYMGSALNGLFYILMNRVLECMLATFHASIDFCKICEIRKIQYLSWNTT